MIKKWNLAAVLAVCTVASLCAEGVVNQLTSNNITAFGGHGDTVCLISAGGINFAAAPFDTFNWWGYRTATGIAPWAVTYGNGRVLACQGTNDETVPNRLFVYNPANSFISTPGIGLSRSSISSMDSIASQILFLGVGATSFSGSFFVACVDGGLLQVDTTGQPQKIFVPGDTMPYSSATFPDLSKLTWFPDSNRSVWKVSASDTTLYVLTKERIWSLRTPVSPKWDSLPAMCSQAGVTAMRFTDLFVDSTTGGIPRIFASAAINFGAGRDSTWLCVFDSTDSLWHPFVKSEPRAVTFGRNHKVYVLYQNKVHLFIDTLPSTSLPFDPASGMVEAFSYRMQFASIEVDFVDLVLQDVFFSYADSQKNYLYIATNNGFFFSNSEYSDEADTTVFRYIKNNIVLKSGLGAVYALPGIITDPGFSMENSLRSSGRTQFMYRLIKSAKVTINVYDWNMDLVKVVTNAQYRLAGGSRPASQQDFWDAKNKLGNDVVPGVYYFKIFTDSGERGFGKIIVGK